MGHVACTTQVTLPAVPNIPLGLHELTDGRKHGTAPGAQQVRNQTSVYVPLPLSYTVNISGIVTLRVHLISHIILYSLISKHCDS